jgi:peptidoglycan/LPS O-acetylase OafA/YrhL
LRYEVLIYAAFPVAALAFINRSFSVKLMAISIALIGLISLQQFTPEMAGHGGFHHLINFSVSFLIGSALWTLRNYVPNSIVVVAFLWTMFWASGGLEMNFFLGVLAAGYSFVWVAFQDISALRYYGKFGDYSYGTYLIHFPIAQTIYGADPTINPYLLVAATLAVTFPIAMISWRYVENPALSQVKTLSVYLSALFSHTQPARLNSQISQAK